MHRENSYWKLQNYKKKKKKKKKMKTVKSMKQGLYQWNGVFRIEVAIQDCFFVFIQSITKYTIKNTPMKFPISWVWAMFSKYSK